MSFNTVFVCLLYAAAQGSAGLWSRNSNAAAVNSPVFDPAQQSMVSWLAWQFFVYITYNVTTQISIISNDTCAEILQPHKTDAGTGAN